MPRDVRAYLADIIDACDAIEAAVEAMDYDAYAEDRLVPRWWSASSPSSEKL
jgi:uncharacterized protein with HEPN domain